MRILLLHRSLKRKKLRGSIREKLHMLKDTINKMKRQVAIWKKEIY